MRIPLIVGLIGSLPIICHDVRECKLNVLCEERPALERKNKQKHSESTQIDLYTANRLHQSLAKLCVSSGLRVYYCGSLRVPRDIASPFRDESPADDMTWALTKENTDLTIQEIVFKFSVCRERSPETIARCTVERKQFYIRVVEIPNGGKVDDQVRSLNGLSVRKVLQRLEKEDSK